MNVPYIFILQHDDNEKLKMFYLSSRRHSRKTFSAIQILFLATADMAVRNVTVTVTVGRTCIYLAALNRFLLTVAPKLPYCYELSDPQSVTQPS